MSATHHPLSIEKLIERQVRSWELRGQQAPEEERRGRGKARSVCFGPYVLISREKGSGGRAVAAMVGERLRWQVFDRQIVDEIARRSKIRQRLIETLDERARGGLEEFIRDFLGHEEIAPGDYLYHLKQVLLTLGHHGDVVIVGRGAEHVLPGHFGLRVWMVAPLELRTERVAKEQGISLEAARSHIERIDTEREKFVRTHFQRGTRNPLDYDLILNTGSLTLENSGEIVLSALQRKLGVSLTGARAA